MRACQHQQELFNINVRLRIAYWLQTFVSVNKLENNKNEKSKNKHNAGCNGSSTMLCHP